MTLDALLSEFAQKSSLLQRDELLNRRLGIEVQIVGELGVIATDYLSCFTFEPRVDSSTAITITYKGEQLKRQLLEYGSFDGVRMNAQLTGARWGETYRYTFALVSIERLYTRDDKHRAKQEAEAKSKATCFVATAAYGAATPTVVLLQEYRDRVLNQFSLGRAFVRVYYLASPPLARFIGTSGRRRLVARTLLCPVVFAVRQQFRILRKCRRRNAV